MGDRVYLPDSGGVYGQKIDSGERETSIVYFDNRTPADGENVRAAGKRWLRARHTDFDQLPDGLFLDRASQGLYRRAPGHPLLSDDTDNVDVFFVRPSDGDGAQIIFLEKTGGTLQELKQETAQAQAIEAQAEKSAVETRQRQLDRQPKRTVTLADLEGRDLPTLREAARVIVEEYRGTIRAKDGQLLVETPELLTATPGGWDAGTDEALQRRRVADATRVLIHARDHVLAELDKRGRLDVERLADVQVGADGTV